MKSLTTFFTTLPKIASVIPQTLILFICVVVAGILLGMVFAVVRLRPRGILKAIFSLITSFERGTPLLIQILITYFGLKAIFATGLGIEAANSWNVGIFAFVAYAINLGAFLGETFRSAYYSIDKGQIEAGMSIGMSSFQIFRRVIVPQGARIALPNMTNLLLDCFKAISLAFSIGFIEMMGRGTALVNARHGIGSVGIYLDVAVCYWVICFILDKLLYMVERHLNRDLRVLGVSNTKKTKAVRG